MLMRSDSKLLKALMFLQNPTMRLPRLFPLYVYAARVGQDTETWCRVTFTRPY